MKLLVMSDLHLEFHKDGGRSFIASLRDDVDGIVLAGDIATISSLKLALTLFCEKYPNVFMTYGNHEFYGSSKGTVTELVRKVQFKHPNLHVLNNSVVEVAGRRFIGTPLWYSRVSTDYENAWSDFRWINNFRQWVYVENKRSVDFLDAEMRKDDIVVTHFLPSHQSVHPKWQGNPTNCFFVHDVENLIRERSPAFWIHGHTHESMQYSIGPTQVVCNPFGYVNFMLNPAFNENLVVLV